MKLISQGGLGNQLFLLNFAHQLKSEKKKNVELITRSLSKSQGDRRFEIGHVLDYCSHEITYKATDIPFDAYNFFDRARLFRESHSKTIQKKLLFVNVSSPFSSPSSIGITSRYVRGYFQSADSVNIHLGSYVQEIFSAMAEQVDQGETIQKTEKYQAIHIRRGDFVNIKKSIGLLALNYYQSGLVDSLPLKIVTDGDAHLINKIKKIFPGSEIHGSESMNTWQAFNLLAHASSLQIANSTFSWWAGVLSNYNGGKVFAPSPWNPIPQEGIENLMNPKFIYKKAIFE